MGALPPPPDTPTARALDARLRGSGSVACVEADELRALLDESGIDEHAAVVACLGWAQRWAHPPISDFHVGAAALGASGRIFLGANLEFAGLPLNRTVHAEQAVISVAWAHGETTLRALATTAAPCGHCRQFMLELPEPRPRLLIPGREPIAIEDLLPEAFGPAQLERAAMLLVAGPHALELSESPAPANAALAAAALAAAQRSNSPYGHSPAGVALELGDGRRFVGGVAESAAFNPTLGPMQGALVTLHHGGGRFSDITAAALVEVDGAPVSQHDAAAQVLAAVAPKVQLHTVLCRWSPGERDSPQ